MFNPDEDDAFLVDGGELLEWHVPRDESNFGSMRTQVEVRAIRRAETVIGPYGRVSNTDDVIGVACR